MPGTPASRREARRDGYRAHVAADPETGIITDEKLTKAAGQENSDPAVAEEFLAAEAGAGPAAAGTARLPAAALAGADGGDPLAWYGDSAYGTGDLRGAIGDAGHQAVIKPKPLQPPVEGGFTVDDFTVDEQAGTVTCPAGHTARLSRTRHRHLRRPLPRTARCAPGAPPASTGRKLSCTNATTCCAPPARTGPPTPGCARTTWPTGPTWNAPSPRSPPSGAVGSSSATAA